MHLSTSRYTGPLPSPLQAPALRVHHWQHEIAESLEAQQVKGKKTISEPERVSQNCGFPTFK